MPPSNFRRLVASNSSFSIENFRPELITVLYKIASEVYIFAENPTGKIKDYGQSGFVNVHYPRCKFAVIVLFSYVISSLKSLLRIKPDVVLTSKIIPNIMFCLLKFFVNFKLICNMIGFGRLAEQKNFLKKCLFKVHLWSLRNAGHVFCQDEENFEVISGYGTLTTSLLFSSGIDFHKVKFEPIIGQAKTILFIGRLIPEKGIDYFLDCCDKFPKLQFVVVGFPELTNKQVLARFKKMKNIANLQFVDGTAKSLNFIRQCSFVCLPSLYREGTPRVLIEALALGRGVITTDRPGCNACIEGGWNGYLLESSDIEVSLANALSEISQMSRDKLIELGRNSRVLAAKFNLNEVIDSYLLAIEAA